ncbi:hypothetical protein OC842_006787 [Tilletia horrida]|uniref:Uncharacterized protein n=1 Tax=Tilletia horrida TaxID=155126 RepID=A0AAN6G5D3_9BASI|nr:hypothetical protein OC842_006787 [Tilletia horrida]
MVKSADGVLNIAKWHAVFTVEEPSSPGTAVLQATVDEMPTVAVADWSSRRLDEAYGKVQWRVHQDGRTIPTKNTKRSAARFLVRGQMSNWVVRIYEASESD